MCKEIPDEEKNDLRKELNKCCSRKGTVIEIKMKESKVKTFNSTQINIRTW